MSDSPMLSVKKASEPKKVTANLLPCLIQHDGPIDPIGAYWKPMDGAGMLSSQPISCIGLLTR